MCPCLKPNGPSCAGLSRLGRGLILPIKSLECLVERSSQHDPKSDDQNLAKNRGSFRQESAGPTASTQKALCQRT